MSLRVSVYVAASLDGFIARRDGDIGWLNDATTSLPPGEDCGYADFKATIDAMVMGRRTYEQVLSFGDWPYGDTEFTVVSSRPIEFPADAPATLRHSSKSPVELCRQLGHEGRQHIYVDGGETIQRFLAAGLIDEITITWIPLLLGDGIPLFGSSASDIPLECLRTKAFDCGFVQVQYRVAGRHGA